MPLEELKRRIDTTEQLQSVVKTMKALAAVSIRQYQKAVDSLSEYHGTIEAGFQVLLRNSPGFLSDKDGREKTHRVLAVVFGADYGMAGRFNEVVASLAAEELDRVGSGSREETVWCMGTRAAASMARKGRDAARADTLPTSVSGITAGANELLLQIDEWSRNRDAELVLLFHNRPKSGAAYEPVSTQLLPLDWGWLKRLRDRPWPTRMLPAYYGDPALLPGHLARQLLFVTVYRTMAESLAGENAARLASMQRAEKNISEQLDGLQHDYHVQRQSAITGELMDVISGFEALTGKSRSG